MPAALAAAAFPPEDPVASCTPGILYVELVAENPVVVAGDVDVGGVGDGTRPGCGWLGGIAGVNEAGVALLAAGLSARFFMGAGTTTFGSSSNVSATLTGVPLVDGGGGTGMDRIQRGTRWPAKLAPV